VGVKENIVNWETRLGIERQLSGGTVDTPGILLGTTLGTVFLGEQRSQNHSLYFLECGHKFKCGKSFKFNNALNVGLAVRDYCIISQTVTF